MDSSSTINDLFIPGRGCPWFILLENPFSRLVFARFLVRWNAGRLFELFLNVLLFLSTFHYRVVFTFNYLFDLTLNMWRIMSPLLSDVGLSHIHWELHRVSFIHYNPVFFYRRAEVFRLLIWYFFFVRIRSFIRQSLCLLIGFIIGFIISVGSLCLLHK